MPEHQQTQQSTESKSTVKKQATPRIQAPSSHPMAIIQRARMNPKSLTHADVMQLQSTIGNRAVVRLLTEIGAIPSKAKQAPPVQRQELVQRQEIPEEEEPLQGKFENKPEIACPSCFAAPIVQRQEIPEEEEPLQGKMIGTVQRQEIPEEEEPLQTKRENNTGMPDNLKTGVENLSGIDISDVRVHYNSSKPAEVGALAYTQGTNIHVASGQEKHLPHEAWHVVQQAQGRVKPTMQLKEGVQVNDDQGLEHEADVMGRKASEKQKNEIGLYSKLSIPATRHMQSGKAIIQSMWIIRNGVPEWVDDEPSQETPITFEPSQGTPQQQQQPQPATTVVEPLPQLSQKLSPQSPQLPPVGKKHKKRRKNEKQQQPLPQQQAPPPMGQWSTKKASVFEPPPEIRIQEMKQAAAARKIEENEAEIRAEAEKLIKQIEDFIETGEYKSDTKDPSRFNFYPQFRCAFPVSQKAVEMWRQKGTGYHVLDAHLITEGYINFLRPMPNKPTIRANVHVSLK